MRSSRARVLKVGVLALALVSTIGLLTGVWLTRSPERTAETPFTGSPGELMQLAGGKDVGTVARASAVVEHVAFSGEQAEGTAPIEVWVDDLGHVLEVYSNDLTVLTEAPEYGDDELAYYQAVVKDADRDSVSITTIDGVAALAVEPNTDTLGTNPGLIRMELEGYSVVISGPDMSVAELTKVASGLTRSSPGSAT
jgi:hypothetical protein